MAVLVVLSALVCAFGISLSVSGTSSSSDLVHQDTVNLLSSQLNQLRSELFQMNSELTLAVSNVKTVTETNTMLRNKVDALEVKTNDLEKRVDKCETDRTKLTDNLNILTNEVDDTKFKVLILGNRFDEVNNLSSVVHYMNTSLTIVEEELTAISKNLNSSVEEGNADLNILKERMSDLETNTSAMIQAETVTLNNRMSDLETNTSAMIQAETVTLNNRMSDLETNTSAKIQAETVTLNNRMSDLETNTSAMIQAESIAIANRLSSLESNISAIIQREVEERDAISRLNATVSKLVRNTGLIGSVRFDVTFKDYWTDGTDKQILKYNKIVLNDGQEYNVSTGVFTCPVSGLYIVSISAASNYATDKVDKKHIYLYKNGESIIGAIAEKPTGTGYGNFDVNSATVPVVLEKGDQLFTKVYFFGTGTRWPGTFSYFSGTLVAPKFGQD